MTLRSVPDQPAFELAVSTPGGLTTVAASGDLDIASADTFSATAAEHLGNGPLRLDLGGLAFMDSSGISALDAMLRLAAAGPHPLTVAPRLQDPVREVLMLTGLLPELPFETDPGAPRP
jgi:anti-sigma B factor antagonist